MKRALLVLLVISGFMANAVDSYACSMEPPVIRLEITDTEVCDSYISYIAAQNSTYSPFRTPYDEEYASSHKMEACSKIPLTGTNDATVGSFLKSLKMHETDEPTVFQLYEELKNYGGYRVIVKQAPEEYETFVADSSDINSNQCNCKKITVVKRAGGWTAYEQTFKDSCSFSAACYSPPILCSIPYIGKNSTMTTLKLLFIALAIITAILVLYKKFVRVQKIKASK